MNILFILLLTPYRFILSYRDSVSQMYLFEIFICRRFRTQTRFLSPSSLTMRNSCNLYSRSAYVFGISRCMNYLLRAIVTRQQRLRLQYKISPRYRHCFLRSKETAENLSIGKIFRSVFLRWSGTFHLQLESYANFSPVVSTAHLPAASRANPLGR